MNIIVLWFETLYNRCVTNCESKIYLIEWDDTVNETKKQLDLTNDKYYRLTQNIRNFVSLTEEDINYINVLPRNNLIEIIKIYNDNISTVQTYFYK